MMAAWWATVAAALGCGTAPPPVLLVVDAGGDAAVLRRKANDAGARRTLQRVGPDGSVRWASDLDPGPGAAADVAVDRSPWLVRAGADGEQIVAVDASNGKPMWRWAAPGPVELRTAGTTIAAMWEEGLAFVERQTGRETWRGPRPGGPSPDVREGPGGLVVGGEAEIRILDRDGRTLMQASLLADCWCGTAAMLAWTDAERRNWGIAAPGTPAMELPISGRVRPGCAARGPNFLVPLHLDGGTAAVAAIDGSAQVAWLAELGPGSHALRDDVVGEPELLPYVIQTDQGRRLVFVDTAAGRAAWRGGVTQAAARAERRPVGKGLAVVVPPFVVTHTGTQPSAVRLPGPDARDLGARVAAEGFWTAAADRPHRLPWNDAALPPATPEELDLLALRLNEP